MKEDPDKTVHDFRQYNSTEMLGLARIFSLCACQLAYHSFTDASIRHRPGKRQRPLFITHSSSSETIGIVLTS